MTWGEEGSAQCEQSDVTGSPTDLRLTQVAVPSCTGRSLRRAGWLVTQAGQTSSSKWEYTWPSVFPRLQLQAFITRWQICSPLFLPELTLVFPLLLPVGHTRSPLTGRVLADLPSKGKVWPNDSFQMASQYFIYRFSLIAFSPSDCAQLWLAVLAYPTQIDFVEFSGPFVYLFPMSFIYFLFLICPFQAFLLNSPRCLAVLTFSTDICQVVIYLLSIAKFKQC